MRFSIDGLMLLISINGITHIFQNDSAGYRQMAATWIAGRKA